MRVKVDAYSGCAGNERPRRFTLGERTLDVVDVLDRWYGEHERYFRVCANDGATYVLKYTDSDDSWELVSFTHQRSQGTDPRRDPGKTIH